jgi:hypothetical protein
LNFSGTSRCKQVEAVAVHRADVHLGEAVDGAELAFHQVVSTRSFSSAAAFSVNVNAIDVLRLDAGLSQDAWRCAER